GALWSRCSGGPDGGFGSTVSGRPADVPGVESMIGMFINTVPTRVRLDGGTDVASWLRGLQDEQASSRQFDFVSLAEVQGWTDLSGGVNLFDSIVVFENYPVDEASAEATGVRARDIEVVDTTNFPLALSAAIGDRLVFDLAYDPRLFDRDTVERMAARLQVVLDGIAAGAD